MDNQENRLVPATINIEKVVASARQMFSAEYPSEESLAQLPDNLDLFYYWSEIPTEIRDRYWEHGVTKGNDLAQLTSTVSIAETNCISGDTATFQAVGWITPYLGGDALVISRIDQPLINPATRYLDLDDGSGKVIRGLAANLGAIILNNRLYPFFDQLKTLYPDLTILKATEVENHVMHEASSLNQSTPAQES